MKKINDDLSINVLNIAAVEKRNNKCFLFMMDGDKYELTENDYDVIAAEIPTLKVDDNFYVNPNAVLTVETIYKNSVADHSIVKLVGDNVAQVTLAEGAIVAAMEPTSGGGGNPDFITPNEFLRYVDGKHIDVDTLVDLLEAKGLYRKGQSSLSDAILWQFDNDVLLLLNGSGDHFKVIDYSFDIGDNTLESAKSDIESYIFYTDEAVYRQQSVRGCLQLDNYLNNGDGEKLYVKFTVDEIKSIFVE